MNLNRDIYFSCFGVKITSQTSLACHNNLEVVFGAWAHRWGKWSESGKVPSIDGAEIEDIN